MIIDTNDLNSARKKILEQKKLGKEVIVKAYDEEYNRKILEIPGVNILLSPEVHNRKDKFKQRDSGLNEFLFKLAKKNKTKIAIDLESLKRLDKIEKSICISRIIQNINLAKKTKTDLIIYPKNKFSKQDIIGFMLSLKSSTNLAKKASS